jgi:hypothetical protein
MLSWRAAVANASRMVKRWCMSRCGEYISFASARPPWDPIRQVSTLFIQGWLDEKSTGILQVTAELELSTQASKRVAI